MPLFAHDDVLSLGTASPTPSMSEFTDAGIEAMEDDSVGGTLRPHKAYYMVLEDVYVRLQAGDVVFRIHTHFFLRESDEARALIEQAKNVKLVLEDVTPDDLERFCDVLYCGYGPPRTPLLCTHHLFRCADTPPLHTQAEWTSVLHLAHRWNFASVRALAIHKLGTLAGPVDRVVLARVYGIKHWLPLAYQTLCEREVFLSDEEGLRLGIEDVLKIGRARTAMRALPVGGLARIDVVRTAFGLQEEHADAQVTFGTAYTESIDTTVTVPASVLPITTGDVVLAPLAHQDACALRTAVAAATSAQQDAQLVTSIFQTLSASVEKEIAEARCVPSATNAAAWTAHRIAQEHILVSSRRLEAYAAQIQVAKAKVERAEEEVTALIASAQLSAQ
jgi:hypothetical protein